MPYQSARDLPSFMEMSQQLASLKLLRFLIPKGERPKVKELEAQLNFLGDTVDKFYATLGPRNWVFHDTLNVQDIADLLAASADPPDAESRLIAYYRGLDNLHFLVRGLGALEALRKRRHLVQRAYDDYMAERYYACIHVLLSVMDGFVNEFEAVRRGLHAREAEELDAFDSVVGHHMGLTRAHATFRSRKGTTSSEPVFELHRNGIVHGTLLNYDNDVVATKAWNRLFALVDWAKSRLKEQKPPPEQPSWKEIIVQLANNARKQKADEAWKPLRLESADEGFKSHAAYIACEQYLVLWRQRNYGDMASMLSSMTRIAYGASMPRQIRQEYSVLDLSSFEIVEIDHTAPAVCEVEAELLLNGTDRRTVRLRWVYEDEEGDFVASSLPGAWRLMIWGPAAFLKD
jgi:hypothetical protein